jgi:hypothetical protein
MYLSNRGGVWYAVGNIGGRLHRVSTGIRVDEGRKRDAVDRMARIRLDIYQTIGKQPRALNAVSGVVYFIATHDRRFVKIGWSSNGRYRLKALQAANPEPLTMLASFSATKAIERRWHERYAAVRQCGEWFLLTPELSAEIDDVTGENRTQTVAA